MTPAAQERVADLLQDSRAWWRRARRPAVALAAVGLILLLAWATRFEYVRAGSGAAFYRVNRWTGSVELCTPSGCRPVAQRPPAS